MKAEQNLFCQILSEVEAKLKSSPRFAELKVHWLANSLQEQHKNPNGVDH
jgi:hypothetical protein